VRRCLLLTIVALAAAGPARAATPIAASMLPEAVDFPTGATVVSEGPGRDPHFPKFPASSTYSRALRNVRLGSALLISLQTSAAVAKRESDPRTFTSSLLFVSRAKVGREALLAQAKNGFGSTSGITSASVVRARDLGLTNGDVGIEFVFRLRTRTLSFLVGEEWVEVRNALAYLVYAAAEPGLSGSQSVALARTMEKRMQLALQAPPLNTTPPAVSGTPQVGTPLSTTNGSWTATAPTFAYQWLRCAPATAQCTAIAGATAATYTATTADQGSTLEASVTATNPAGHATARSAPTAAVG
jgi:hypothetical protein